MPQTPSVASKRENVFDIMRGLAIIGVVYIHGGNVLSSSENVVLGIAYFWWAVPVFLILSALFSIRSLKTKPVPIREFLAKRYRKLFPVFFVFSLIYFLIMVDWKTLTLGDLISKHFGGFGWSGQYFFIILFQLLLLYPLFARIEWTRNKLLVVFAVTLVAFPILAFLMTKSSAVGKIGYRPFFYWLPYSIFGAYLAQHEELFQSLPKRFPPIPATLTIIVLPLSILWENSLGNGQQGYVLDSVFITSIVGFTLAPSALSRWQNRGAELIALLGRYSLGIFCLNPLVITGLSWLIKYANLVRDLPHGVQVISPLIVVPLICACCMLLVKAIEKIGGKNFVT